MITFSVAVPGGSERTPTHVAHLLIACGPILKDRSLSFGYQRIGLQVVLTVTVAEQDAETLRSQLADAFPDATIDKLPRATGQAGEGGRLYRGHVWLKPEIYLLRCSADFEDRLTRTLTDPVTQVLSAMQSGRGGDTRIKLTLRRARESRCRRAECVALSLQLLRCTGHRPRRDAA